MPYSLSRRDLDHGLGYVRRGMHYAHLGHSPRGYVVSGAKSEKALGQVVQASLTAGSSFGFGFLAGYRGTSEVFGVPVELIAGTFLQGLDYIGFGGKWSKAWSDLGTGAYSAWTTRKGAQIGDAIRRGHGLKIRHPAFPSASGQNAFVGGDRRPMSENELAAFAVSARS